MEKPDLIIDAGANRGEFSLLLAARNPGLRVLAIEPEPHLAAELRRNASKQSLRNHSTIQVALANSDGDARFFVSHEGDWGTSSLLQFDANHLAGDEYWATRPDLRHTSETTVSTRRLETILDAEDYNQIAFLKIDTQGLDLEVLRSLGTHLSRLEAGMLEVVGIPSRSLYIDEGAVLSAALYFLEENAFEPYAIKPNDPASNEFNLFFVRTGLNYREVEERLALRGVHMYDGKHYWLLPSPVLRDPAKDWAELHARIELLSVQRDQALRDAELLEGERAAVEQLHAELAKTAAQVRELDHRCSALGAELQAAFSHAGAAQDRCNAAQIRADAAEVELELHEKALAGERLLLREALDQNALQAEALATAAAERKAVEVRIARLNDELQRLKHVEAMAHELATDLDQSRNSLGLLTARLSFIQSQPIYRAFKWAFRHPPAQATTPK